jgi:uncharacterized protein (TIGR02594 family)
MRKSKASTKRQPTKAKVTKRTTSRRATTSRSRTSSKARRTRRVSPKAVPPVSLVELPNLLEQAIAETPPLPSKRYPIRNLLVLFLAFAAITAVGGWAVYFTVFGEARQDIAAATPPVVVEMKVPGPEAAPAATIELQPVIPSPPTPPSRELTAPKAQDRMAPAPSVPPISSSAPETPRPPPESLEVTAAAIPEPTGGSTARSSGRPVPTAAKSKRRQRSDSTTPLSAISPGGPVSSAYALVTEARRYLGTNPTGRKDLWCGAFLDMVLKRIGYRGGGNLASAYARYGTRISGPQIGAIAVMWRQGGGHVGIVTGLDKQGNPIIISGNYQKRVAEAVYPRGRVYAYVIPDDRQRIAAARAQITADEFR